MDNLPKKIFAYCNPFVFNWWSETISKNMEGIDGVKYIRADLIQQDAIVSVSQPDISASRLNELIDDEMNEWKKAGDNFLTLEALEHLKIRIRAEIQQPTTTPSDKDSTRLDWLQNNHYTILACHQPHTFMITSMGKPSGTNEDIRQAIDMAIKNSTIARKDEI